MTKAEEAALKAYPVEMTPLNYQDLIEQFGGKTEIDVNTYPRCLFQHGYEQAEKNLSLTWKDMQLIWQICDTINDTERRNTDLMCSSKAYFSEVLRRFNNARKEQ